MIFVHIVTMLECRDINHVPIGWTFWFNVFTGWSEWLKWRFSGWLLEQPQVILLLEINTNRAFYFRFLSGHSCFNTPCIKNTKYEYTGQQMDDISRIDRQIVQGVPEIIPRFCFQRQLVISIIWLKLIFWVKTV